MNVHPKVLAFVLAGGEGSRLHPLTASRCKPAVKFRRRHRLVDFVLSNLVNSGIDDIALVVQHKPDALVEHVRRQWTTPPSMPPLGITVLAPQTAGGAGGYRGTADAVFQNLRLIRAMRPDLVAVFGADHIYRMDVRQMIDFHLGCAADATVSTVPVELRRCGQFGIVEVDGDHRVCGFSEKPAVARPMPGSHSHALASMGNYVFETGVLLEQLERMHARGETDFGHHVLPSMVASHKLVAYDFAGNTVPGLEPGEERGYWRDVGTIDAYYEAYFDTHGPGPKFNLVNPRWPIHAGVHDDPLDGANESDIQSDCILMDGARVGAGASVRRAIIGEDNHVPAGERIGFDIEEDRKRFVVTDGGVVVVPAGFFPRRRPQPPFVYRPAAPADLRRAAQHA